MKKIASIIAICMVLVLSFPSVPVFAMDIDNFCIRAQSTTSADWPYGQVVLQDITANEGYREQVLECLKTFDMSLLDDYDYYAILSSRSSGTTADGTYSLVVICFNSDVEPYIVNCNSSVGSFSNQRIFAKLNETFYLCSASYTASSHTSFDNILYSNSFSGSYFYGDSSGEYGYANFEWLTYDANFPVYYEKEVKSISGFSDDRRWGWTTYADNRAGLTDLFADAEGYNLQGQVVSPGGGDGEENPHLGFRKIDGNVIYNSVNKTYSSARVVYETDPTGFEILESRPLNDWVMDLTYYCSYTLNKYPDGNVYVAPATERGGFSWSETRGFSSSNDEFSLRGGSFVVDPLRAADVEGLSENAYMFATLVTLMNDGVSTGKQTFDQYGQFWGRLAELSIDFTYTGFLSELLEKYGMSVGDFLNSLGNTNYYYSLGEFTLQVSASIRSIDNSIKGLPGNVYFDLTSHTSSSYAEGTTPLPSVEDPDPVPQVPYEFITDVPVEPSGINPDTGVMTYVPVNVQVNVNVPSTSVDGNNNMTQNYNPTISQNVSIDSGVDEIAEVVDKYPSVDKMHFWEYFLVFKDNEFVQVTKDFFEMLPTEVYATIFSSIGIITVIAIFRFFRRG